MILLFRFSRLQPRTSFHARLFSSYFVPKLTKTKKRPEWNFLNRHVLLENERYLMQVAFIKGSTAVSWRVFKFPITGYPYSKHGTQSRLDNDDRLEYGPVGSVLSGP